MSRPFFFNQVASIRRRGLAAAFAVVHNGARCSVSATVLSTVATHSTAAR